MVGKTLLDLKYQKINPGFFFSFTVLLSTSKLINIIAKTFLSNKTPIAFQVLTK